MAEIVDESRWGHRLGVRKDRYPWDEWLDGKTRILTRGEDFKVPARSMQTMVATMARIHQVGVRTSRLDDDRIMIQAIIG